jgi:uncharacterized protein YwgA
MSEMKCLEIIDDICEKVKPGKKTIQKLLYLIERKGINLNLDYSIHFFGPYSSKLDDYLHKFESDQILQIDTSGRTHIISVLDKDKINNVLDETDVRLVHETLSIFLDNSPLELEALTTIDYVAQGMGQSDDEHIIRKVKEIKGEKFADDFLREKLEVLKHLHYFQPEIARGQV